MREHSDVVRAAGLSLAVRRVVALFAAVLVLPSFASAPLRHVTAVVPDDGGHGCTYSLYLRALLDRIAETNGWQVEYIEVNRLRVATTAVRGDIYCGVLNTAETRARFDFPMYAAGENPIILLARAGDTRFAGTPSERWPFARICYSPKEPEVMHVLARSATKLKIRYTYEATSPTELFSPEAALTDGTYDLALADAHRVTDAVKPVALCGEIPFYFVTLRGENADLREAIDDTLGRFLLDDDTVLCTLARTYLRYGAYFRRRIVRVGTFGVNGLCETGPDGEMGGFAVDYLRRVAELKGWHLHFVRLDFHMAAEAVAAGKIDIAPDIFRTPERLRDMLFSERDVGPVYYALQAHRDGKVRVNRPETWRGLRVGSLVGSQTVASLGKFLAARGVDWVSRTYDDSKQILQKVRAGELDAVYLPLSQSTGDLLPLMLLPTPPVYFAVSKTRPDLKSELDAAMVELAMDGGEFTGSLLNRHFPARNLVSALTLEELAYVRERKGRPVRVDCSPGTLFPDEIREFLLKRTDTGAVSRVAAEGTLLGLFSLLEEFSGLSFELLSPTNRSEARRRLRTGVSEVRFHNGDGGPDGDGAVQLPRAFVPDCAFVHLRGKRLNAFRTVALLDDFSELRRFYSGAGFTVFHYIDRDACYAAVLNGVADFAVDINQVAQCRVMEIPAYADLEASPIASQRIKLSLPVGVSVTTDPRLRSILQKSFASIPRDSVRELLEEQKRRVRGENERRRRRLNHYLGALIAALLTVVAWVYWSIRLRIERERRRLLEEKQRQTKVIVEQKHALEKQNEVISDALEQARAASAAKSTFLSSMSHDIRTPMNAVIGLTGLAEAHLDEPAKVRTCLAKIGVASDHLLSLINGVLDMSQIESGKLVLNETEESLEEILSALRDIMQVSAVKKNLDFEMDVRAAAGARVFCDRLRLKQILLNIISNAIKYTPAGGHVFVRVFRETGGAPGLAMFRFHVKDTGIGMSEQFQKEMFKPFTRERNTTMGGVSGTGLGMAIMKDLVDKMGGRVTVVSEEGKGTEVVVSLTFREAGKTDGPARADAVRFDGYRVLLVEDNDVNQEISTAMLDQLGFSVDLAVNGAEAVEMVSRSLGADGTARYDLVLMDVQMPVMDGYAATRAIRALPGGADLPIVAVSANAFKEDRIRSLAAGMNDHVAKPIRLSALTEVLGRLLPAKEGR